MPFSGQEMTDKKVVAWKFNQLDKDRDRHLKRREVRNLRRMLKKLVRPKACAKTFVTYCDSNRDKKISTTEWKLCLRVDPRSKSGFTVGSLLFSVNCQDFSLHDRELMPDTWHCLTSIVCQALLRRVSSVSYQKYLK